MGYHPRIESSELASFLTTRSRNSELWFVNNPKLEQAILGYAARYVERYQVKLYALAIEGSHIQGPAHFPLGNRASFMRDFNSSVARAVDRLTPEYPGGRFWGRRYSQEFLPSAEDIEEYFFYTVLQPVKDGLVEKISKYPFYNCFHDAVYGIKRKYKVVRWAEYHKRKAYDPSAKLKDFTDIVTLKYERLPGYEHLTQQQYAKYMHDELERRRQQIVAERLEQGLGFMGVDALLSVARGSLPKNPKRSDIYTHRPRILCVCNKRRAEYKAWYFEIYYAYKDASRRYRAGEVAVEFPEGTYYPPPNLPPPPTTKA